MEGLGGLALDPLVAQDGALGQADLHHRTAEVGALAVVFFHQLQLGAGLQHHEHAGEDRTGGVGVGDEEQVQGQGHLEVAGHQDDGAVLEAGTVQVLEELRGRAVLDAAQGVAGFAGGAEGQEADPGGDGGGAAGVGGVAAIHEDLAGAHHLGQQQGRQVDGALGGRAEGRGGEGLQIGVFPVLILSRWQVPPLQPRLRGFAQRSPLSGPWPAEQLHQQAGTSDHGGHRAPPAADSARTQS